MLPAEKFNEKIARWLVHQPFWHGYLPREDLPFILKKKGDFVVRSTERPSDKRTKRRELVLSIACPELPVTVLDSKDIKSIFIERTASRIYIETAITFTGLDMLIEYYKNHVITSPKTHLTFKLVRGVGLAPWEYKHSHVTLDRKIGEGAYGEVFKSVVKRGKMRPFEAAIKTIRADDKSFKGDLKQPADDKTKEVLDEARLMRMLNHPNIVRIRGIAVLEQPLYLIIDFIPGGSLDNYLKKHQNVLTMDDKNKMAISAAWAIEYVHSQDIIHRDIAARNCLYDPRNFVKLSDFGLARKGNAYRMKECRKMPTKWLAPESMMRYMFSRASDVYTFGILLYEIYSCSEPYKGLTGAEAKKKILAAEFPEMSNCSPPEMFKLVKKSVFVFDPKKRAQMKEIVKVLEEWLEVELALETDDANRAKEDSTPLNMSAMGEEKDDKSTRPVESPSPSQTLPVKPGLQTKNSGSSVEKKASDGTIQRKKQSSIQFRRRRSEVKDNVREEKEEMRPSGKTEEDRGKDRSRGKKEEKEEDSKCDETKKVVKKTSTTTVGGKPSLSDSIRKSEMSTIMDKTTDMREKDELVPPPLPKNDSDKIDL